MTGLSHLSLRLALLSSLLAAPLAAQSLDGTWDLLVPQVGQHHAPVSELPPDDGRIRGDEHLYSTGWEAPVPGAAETIPLWESIQPGVPFGDDGPAFAADGVFWYRRLLPEPAPLPEGWLRELQFDAVNDRADVWLDGRHLGRHDGSDAPFAFDVTELPLSAGQALVVRVVDPGHDEVDGLVLSARPHAKESWYHNYGGITGSVRLAAVPPVEARLPDLLWEGGDTATLRLDLLQRGDVARHTEVLVQLGDGREVAAPAQLVAPGRSELRLQLSVAGLAPWSPESPTRHALRISTTAAGVTHTTTRLVGLRHFAVDGSRFVLNGEPRVLHGVLFQPFFPGGLCQPPTDDFLRDELAAIKAAGFDLVRAHIRVMPRVYALCDELGLLVHAEPTLGWITELRLSTWPLVDQSLVTLADAVRGHPSVVLVGLLNELSGQLFVRTAQLLERAHGLLPGHLILDDSGSWQGSAHYWNPGADAPVPYDDLHVYRAWPWEPRDLAFAAELGDDHERLVFVSEFGFGGMPTFDAALAGFAGRHGTPDAQEALTDQRAALAELASGRLDGLAHDLSSLAALGQRNQARALELMAAALRGNPRVAGDVVTQWRDASWENGAGLVDLWGTPKPALSRLAALNALDRRPTLADVERPATPPERDAPTRVARLVLAPGDSAPAGLDDALLAALEPLLVQAAAAPDDDDDDDGDGDDSRGGRDGLPGLAVQGRVAAPWSAEQLPRTLSLLRFVKDGGVLLWLDAPDAGRPLDAFLFGYDGLGQVADLPFDLQARNSRGHFVGTHQVFREGSPLLAGLDVRDRLMDERLGLVAPHRVLRLGDGVREARRELACLDGYGLDLGASVATLPFGRGALVLSTLRFGEQALADPFGRRLFENLVGLAAAEAAARGPSPSPPEVAVDAPLARDVGRMVWRAKLRFGQAERLAVQTENGVRGVRHELPGQGDEARRLAGLLRLLIAGRVDSGLRDAVAQLADLPPRDEDFLRKELDLSRRFYRPDVEQPAPRELAHTLGIGRAHATALRLLREGQREQALAAIQRAIDLVRALDGPGADPQR